MKRKRFFLYLVVVGLLVLAGLTVYVYQEYLGEDTDPTPENKQNPIIARKVDGIITTITVNTVGQQQKLDVTYRDCKSNETAHLAVNAEYGQRIHPGDTVTKDKGEKILMVNQKGGLIEIVPID